MNKQQRAAFLDVLVANAFNGETGDIAIHHEPKLKGPFQAPDADDYYIALYPQGEKVREWLLKQEGAISRTGRVDPYGTFQGKYYLHNDAISELRGREYTQADESMLPHRPLALPMMPPRTRMAISPLKHTKDGHDYALVIAVPAAVRETALTRLREYGLLPKRDGEKPGFVTFTSDETDAATCVIPLRTEVVQALLDNPHHTFEDWTEGEKGPAAPETLSLQKLMLEATEHLHPVPLEKKEEEPVRAEETESAPAPKKELPTLAEQPQLIAALEPKVAYELQPNGDRKIWLEVNKGEALNALRSSEHTREHLRLWQTRRVDDKRERHEISEAELQRLQEALGRQIGETTPYPFNEGVLKGIFSPRSVGGKTKVPVKAVAFTKIELPVEGAEPRYCVYISASDVARLNAIGKGLRLHPSEIAMLTQEDETPQLVRLTVPEHTWVALKKKAVQEEISRDRSQFASLRQITVPAENSLYASDAHVRGALDISLATQQDATNKKQEQDVVKLTNGEAIEFLAQKLEAIPAERMRLAAIMRQRTKHEAPQGELSLFINGTVDDLIPLSTELDRETDMFTKGNAIKYIWLSEKSDQKNGVLEIKVDRDILDALVTHLDDPHQKDVLSTHKPVEYAHNVYKDAMRQWCREYLQHARELDDEEKAWNHLKEVQIVPVKVSAPNKERLTMLEQQLERVRAVSRLLKSPLDELETIEKNYSDVLKTLSNNKGDALVIRELQTARHGIRKMVDQVENGVPTRLAKRIETLQQQYDKIKAAGLRTEYVLLAPEHRTQRLLKPLAGRMLASEAEEIIGTRGMLRLVPHLPEKFADTLRRRGILVHNADKSQVVPNDDLAEWAQKTKKYRDEEAAREKAARGNPDTRIHGAKPDGMVKGGAQKTEEATPYIPMRNVEKQLEKSLRDTGGILTWERQEPQFENTPTQERIGEQAVLALSATTHDELKAVKQLYHVLKEEGWLMERPRFYGEIVPGNKCKPKEEEPDLPDNKATARRELLEARESMFGRIKATLEDVRYFAKASNGPQLKEALAQLAWDMKPLADEPVKLREEESLKTLLADLVNGTRPVPEAGELADRKLRDELKTIQNELLDLTPDMPRPGHLPTFKPKAMEGYITSIVRGNESLYPVDGRAGSGREPEQLDVWRRIVSRVRPDSERTEGIPALKLYIKPEALPHLQELIGKTGTVENILAETHKDAYTADMIATRMFHLQQSQQEQPRGVKR